ncbi:MAG: WGR domain-containing protein [Gammaproteobacteria bacterium]|jgi:hypothetical protein
MNTLNMSVSTAPTNFDKKPMFKSLRFEKGTRYYSVILEQDLFEDWVITIINGRINTKLGGIRKLAFSNVSDAIVKLDAITQTRIKRKYMQL